MGNVVKAIPEEGTVRQRLAELASERRLLRSLLRLSQQKRQAERRAAGQRKALIVS
jgi:hypothetical protein